MNGRRITFLVAGALLLVAGLLAGVRWSQTRITVPARDLEFTDLNALTWDPATRELTVTGEDPFGFVVLPSGSLPLVQLALTFEGAARPGGWYVYPAPADLPVVTIEQRWVVTAEMTAAADDEFSATWTFQPSQAARVDLPDELTTPLKVRSAQFSSPFVAGANGVFAWMVTAAVAGLAVLLMALIWPWADRPWMQLLVAAALVALKATLVSTMGLTIFAHAMHDDKLFMDQGMSIKAGEWLGPFWQLTLAKGPAYSVFLALSSSTGWPLQVNEALFHGIAAVLFVAALAPWLRGAPWRLALLMVILLEPHSLSGEELSRVLRAGIQPALTLLTLAGLLGLVTRARDRWWAQLPWAGLAGLAGGAFWLSREEGIWLMPTSLLLWGSALVLAGTASAPRSRRIGGLLLLMLPVLLFQGVRQTLRVMNQTHYGVAIGVDVSEGSFADAYGAMVRVTAAEQIPGVPVTRETRLRIYEVSPSFAELRERLEGALSESWAKLGWDAETDSPHAFKEIKGGWYQWAIRQAAAEADHYRSAGEAEAYWRRVADEINAACDDGRLAGGRRRSGFFPAWQSAYNGPVVKAWFAAVDLLVRFTDFKPHGIGSDGDPDAIARYADFLHATPVIDQAKPDAMTAARTIIQRVFASLGWPLTALALAATGGLTWRARRPDSGGRARVAVLLALWGGAASLCAVCALVHVTSFYALIGAYLGPACPMILATWVLAPVWAWGKPPESPARS